MRTKAANSIVSRIYCGKQKNIFCGLEESNIRLLGSEERINLTQFHNELY